MRTRPPVGQDPYPVACLISRQPEKTVWVWQPAWWAVSSKPAAYHPPHLPPSAMRSEHCLSAFPGVLPDAGRKAAAGTCLRIGPVPRTARRDILIYGQRKI